MKEIKVGEFTFTFRVAEATPPVRGQVAIVSGSNTDNEGARGVLWDRGVLGAEAVATLVDEVERLRSEVAQLKERNENQAFTIGQLSQQSGLAGRERLYAALDRCVAAVGGGGRCETVEQAEAAAATVEDQVRRSNEAADARRRAEVQAAIAADDRTIREFREHWYKWESLAVSYRRDLQAIANRLGGELTIERLVDVLNIAREAFKEPA